MVALLMAATGCGGSDDSDSAAGPFSCTASAPGAAGGAAKPELCIDTVGGSVKDAADYRQKCSSTPGSTFAPALCPHAGSTGGCRQTFGSVQTTTWWYDSDMTTADTKSLCDGLASVAGGSIKIEFVLP